MPRRPAGQSRGPAESAPWQALAQAPAALVRDLPCRRPVTTAMLDVDATGIACDRRAAPRSDAGRRGSPPVLVRWAEQDGIVAQEVC